MFFYTREYKVSWKVFFAVIPAELRVTKSYHEIKTIIFWIIVCLKIQNDYRWKPRDKIPKSDDSTNLRKMKNGKYYRCRKQLIHYFLF